MRSRLLRVIPSPHPSEGPDRISWSHTSSGAFSVKTAYKAFKEGYWNSRDKKWKNVWKFPGSQHVCIFIWTILQGRIVSNVERVRGVFRMTPPVSFMGITRKIFYTFYETIWLLRMFGLRLIQGILDGLKLVQRRGYDQVIIHSDSLEVVKGILGSSSTVSNSALIRRIHNILSQENQWFLRYIPSEQNQVADCLAKQTLIEKVNLQILDIPPEMVHTFFDRDKSTVVTFAQTLIL
ncbi:hypothetical protein Gogos_000913 [Gossypium gossypioides]|uniref:RNase H type-1 domain-containing protein n=1 Tax=Gossypium gossypioides TaxID=34282 RepID=A0A7J9CUB7_GOSGO|nr:hypothetical protein [Gossypium gossypioides]